MITTKPPASLESVRILMTSCELDLAEQDLLEIRSLHPNDPAVAVVMAELHRRRGLRSEALELYRLAGRLDPSDPEGVIGEIELRLETGDRATALCLAEATVERCPGSLPTLATYAMALHANGRTEEAAALIEHALAGQDLSIPQERSLLFILGDLRDRLGDYESAWTAIERANRLMGVRLDRVAATRDVEAAIAVFDRAALTALPQAAPGHVRPVFLAGMPRSGKTLLEQILDRHPHVTGGGEMNLLNRCALRVEPLTGITTPYPHGVREFTADHVHTLADFTGRELNAAGNGSPVVTDATPSCMNLGLAELLHPDARIVIVERDPLDTCLSCFFKRFKGRHDYAYDLEDLAFFLRLQERLLEHWRHTLDLPIKTLRYEDLVADQEHVTRDLLEFLGLEWDDACLSFHENDRVVNTLSAGQVRERMYRTAVGRSRNYEGHLGPLRAALGISESRVAA